MQLFTQKPLVLTGPVDHEMLGKVLRAQPNGNTLTVTLTTEGGDVYSALGICDYLNHLQADGITVNIVAVGYCMSAGVDILQSATNRASLPNTTFMLHLSSLSLQGSSVDVDAWRTNIKNLDKHFLHRLAARTEQPTDFWKEKLASDYVITAKQALRDNIIDQIIKL